MRHVERHLHCFALIGVIAGLLALPHATTSYATPRNCPGAPASQLVIGRESVTTAGVPNLRDRPGLAGKIYVQIPANVRVMVLDGPFCADQYAWWKVDYQDQTGYIAEGDSTEYYALPTTTAIAVFDLGTKSSIDIRYQGIRFTYTGVAGPIVEADNVFAVAADPNDPMLFAAPEYTEFRFRQSKGDISPYGPTLSIYAVEDFKTANADVGQLLDKLESVLSKKPRSLGDDFPVIPMPGAGQVFHSNVNYMDFGSGSGIRFVTMYSQDVSPITPDRTVVVFEGLTGDTHYYVTATLPITPDVLTSKPVPVPDLNATNAGDLYMQYITKTVANLNKSTADQFTPNMDDVDAMLASVTMP